MVQQLSVGQGLIEASRSHSVGFLSISNLPDTGDLYLTTQDTNKRQTSMPPTGFELAIPASYRLQIHVLDRATTDVGLRNI